MLFSTQTSGRTRASCPKALCKKLYPIYTAGQYSRDLQAQALWLHWQPPWETLGLLLCPPWCLCQAPQRSLENWLCMTPAFSWLPLLHCRAQLYLIAETRSHAHALAAEEAGIVSSSFSLEKAGFIMSTFPRYGKSFQKMLRGHQHNKSLHEIINQPNHC